MKERKLRRKRDWERRKQRTNQKENKPRTREIRD